MKGKVIGVSLGPGDPELITLKALKALQEADAIYCPGTRNKEGISKSYSSNILRGLPIDGAKIVDFHVPMSKDRTFANQAYDQVCMEISERVAQGAIVAITAEGDSGFYSSGNYMFEKLKSAGIPISTIAGIPAFIAAGAISGLHIVKQEEKLIVLPGHTDAKELQHLLSTGHVVVIMKLSQCPAEIRDFMIQNPGHEYHYYENVGATNEHHTTLYNDILTKEYPYFSLMIIRE